MKVILTRQNPDGSYDEVGMNNRRLHSHYKTVQGALRYALKSATPDWRGVTVRFEFFHDAGFLNAETKPFKTVEKKEK
jgi:hypothetical protein